MDASNLRRPHQLQRGELHCGGCDRKEAAILRNVGQSEPPGGFVCSFMRALLHVLDRGRAVSVASPLSTLLPMAWQPSQMSSCNRMMRTCRFVLGRADGSGRSVFVSLAVRLGGGSPVGRGLRVG